MVCEGKVVLHSIQSASSLEVSRALLDGKAISCATPVLMHNSGLLPSGAGSHKQASFHPLLAVGTSAGIIFIVEPVSGTVRGRAWRLIGSRAKHCADGIRVFRSTIFRHPPGSRTRSAPLLCRSKRC